MAPVKLNETLKGALEMNEQLLLLALMLASFFLGIIIYYLIKLALDYMQELQNWYYAERLVYLFYKKKITDLSKHYTELSNSIKYLQNHNYDMKDITDIVIINHLGYSKTKPDYQLTLNILKGYSI